MSFLDDVFDFGAQAVDWITSSSTATTVAKAAVTGFALYKLNSNVNKQNTLPATAASITGYGRESIAVMPATAANIDRGVRLQVNPDPEHSIPVVYGEAWLGGIVTHAEITNNNTIMYVVLTICERTGVKMSDSVQSVISFEEILVNDQEVVFTPGGQVISYTMDREGNVDNSLSAFVEIRCFSGGSQYPVEPVGYSGGSTQTAWEFVPSWTSTDTMNNLIFAVMKVTYNRDKGITSLPDVKFRVSNTLDMPGDCLYDYMTNTRYGAGIPSSEIYSA